MSGHTRGLRAATGKRFSFVKAAHRAVEAGESCAMPRCSERATTVVEFFGYPYAAAFCPEHAAYVRGES